jgi:hypothetical protein
MIQKHRISTNIGRDQKVTVELKQDYDLLEILSLKFTQVDAYSSMCSDYGVVVGRISVNNGLGIPNARVSIFIPLDDVDSEDPVISKLYPFTTISDKNDDGYRYNLLPSRKQHGGHEPTGTFPDQRDVLTREEVLEVYEKYYKYTAKTNDAGDFMIWGVPLGTQTIHVDVDLSDISCFSLRPDDFIRQGMGVDSFKNSYSYKSSNDIDALPQIISFNQTIEVYPFWGNEDLCEIGITRTDFDLSDKGVKIEPKAYLLGSVYSDQGTNTVNKNCTPKGKMGRKCDLTTFPAKVEIIRFTTRKDDLNRPILEFLEIEEDVDDDGSFVLPLPMNLDYMYTNEFGEMEITNDTNKGIPTSSCYRFRISVKNDSLGRVRTTASYLIPNIREFQNDIDASYAWSTNWTDYPADALNSTYIFNSVLGSYYPDDFFYRFTYNKVYAVSSFMGSLYSSGGFNRHTFLGIKEISPKEEEDCQSEVNTPPTNWGLQKFNFSILLAIIINIFERIIYIAFVGLMQVLIWPFQIFYDFRIYIRAFRVTLINWRPFKFLDKVIEAIQRFGTVRLGLAIYPECENCDQVDAAPAVPDTTGDVDPALVYEMVGYGTALRDYTTIIIDCDEYELYGDALLGSTFTYVDCTGSTSTSLYVDPGLTETRCVKSGTLSTLDGTYSLIVGCDATVSTPWLDPNSSNNELVLSDVNGFSIYTTDPITGKTLSQIYDNNATGTVYIIKLISYLGGTPSTVSYTGLSTTLNIDTYTDVGNTYHLHSDSSNSNQWIVWNGTWTGVTYEIYDSTALLTGTGTTVNQDDGGLPSGCGSYMTVYNESIVSESYCSNNADIAYSGLSTSNLVSGPTCSNFVVGQVIKQVNSNPCSSCVTHSGYSEFRRGVFTIIPAAKDTNWTHNFKAIGEYCRRKLVAKLFCEGVVNYSFTDNWLSGSLYLFPFKAKVRWDDEGALDLNNRRTNYCGNLVRFKIKEKTTGIPDKRFYYRSAKFNGSSFSRWSSDSTLGHPTTIVDLGPRDEFIKEICIDPALDPNCSVVRSIGPSSFQDFKEMLGLYLNYKMDTLGTDGGYTDMFDNNGFDSILPSKMDGYVLNGDILQLISINNEVGIQEFDLQNKNYVPYSYQVVDPDDYPTLFESSPGVWGPLPINFVLDDDGYRVRVCLNEPGRLTESSQNVPFFLWDKQGTGFGVGTNQSWDYGSIQNQPLQGMTYNYNYTGDSSWKYVLFPMGKDYAGLTKTISGVSYNEVTFNIERTSAVYTATDYLIFNNQEEGFTYLYVTSWSSGTSEDERVQNALTATLYTRTGNTGGWASQAWTYDTDFIIKPTTNNYGNSDNHKQILSTPFLFYFGLRPGKTAVDKFIQRFGPKGAFPQSE